MNDILSYIKEAQEQNRRNYYTIKEEYEKKGYICYGFMKFLKQGKIKLDYKGLFDRVNWKRNYEPHFCPQEAYYKLWPNDPENKDYYRVDKIDTAAVKGYDEKWEQYNEKFGVMICDELKYFYFINLTDGNDRKRIDDFIKSRTTLHDQLVAYQQAQERYAKEEAERQKARAEYNRKKAAMENQIERLRNDYAENPSDFKEITDEEYKEYRNARDADPWNTPSCIVTLKYDPKKYIEICITEFGGKKYVLYKSEKKVLSSKESWDAAIADYYASKSSGGYTGD